MNDSPTSNNIVAKFIINKKSMLTVDYAGSGFKTAVTTHK